MQKKLSRLKKHNSCCNFAMFTTNYRTKNWNGIEEVEEISAFHDQTIPNPEPIPSVTMITRYCSLWIQMGPHGFKTCLEGYDPHANTMRTMFSLCPSGLWGKTNKYPYGAKQTSYRGQRSTLIPLVTTSSQSRRYCLLWIQRGPHGFKRRLQGIYT